MLVITGPYFKEDFTYRLFPSPRRYRTDSFPTSKWVTEYVTSQGKRTVSGFKTANWRDRVRSHQSASTPCETETKYPGLNPYVALRVERINPRTPTLDRLFEGGVYQNAVILDASPLSAIDSAMENRALGKFYAKCADALTPVQGGVILGELKETIRGLVNPLRGANSLLRAYHGFLKSSAKKHRLGTTARNGGRRFVKDASDQWLEVQYAIKPLIGDIDDILEYILNQGSALTTELLPVKATVKAERILSEFTLSDNVAFNDGSLGIRYYYRLKEKLSIRYRGVVALEVADPTRRILMDFGVHNLNFLPTLYEVIPYSFLLDYFTNVGLVIQSTMVPRTSIPWFNKTNVVERKRYVEVLNYTTDSRFWRVVGDLPTERTESLDGATAGTASYHRRTRRSGDAGPNLPLPKLSWEPHLTALKWANMGALLGSFAASEFRPRGWKPSERLRNSYARFSRHGLTL